jgi:hypothetical protein
MNLMVPLLELRLSKETSVTSSLTFLSNYSGLRNHNLLQNFDLILDFRIKYALEFTAYIDLGPTTTLGVAVNH